MLQLIEQAVNTKQVLAITYDGKTRVIEPHALGINAKGKTVLRAYQVAGESATNPQSWKLFSLDKIEDLEIVNVVSEAPRAGYRSGDAAMVTILAQLPDPVPA